MIEILFLECFWLREAMWFRRHGDFDERLSDLSPQRSKASSEVDGDGFVPGAKTRSIAWAQWSSFLVWSGGVAEHMMHGLLLTT